MAVDDFNPADLTAVLTALRAGGVRAETDPAQLQAPGVWLRFDGLDLDNLAGLTVRTTAHVITGELDQSRAMGAVAALFNQVKQVLRDAGLPIFGPVTPVAVVLPGSQTGLPGLAVPLEILTSN